MASARSPPAATAVSFTENKNNGTDLSVEDVKQQEQKTKFLTMKYGQNQIRLIQKRLKIEFWIDAELKTLYSIDVSTSQIHINPFYVYRVFKILYSTGKSTSETHATTLLYFYAYIASLLSLARTRVSEHPFLMIAEFCTTYTYYLHKPSSHPLLAAIQGSHF